MIRIGPQEQFRAVREYLAGHYTEGILCRELGIPTLVDFHTSKWSVPKNPLVSVLFTGKYAAEDVLASVVPAGVLDAMLQLGLLERTEAGIYSPVLLYPFHDLHIVSDRFTNPDGTPLEPARDFVYCALTRNTQRYVGMLSQSPCEAFLDVGSGSGAAAFVAARYAARTWAADVDARCTDFARFNRELNNIRNAEVVEGSLYEPVAGLTFDRIACHPPYELKLSSRWTFADGGDDGEFVLRGAIEGLSRMLRPGGRFYALARAADRTGAPLEHRLRNWLRPAQGEFDVGIVVIETSTPEEVAIANVLASSEQIADFRAYMDRYSQLEVEQLVYAHIVIARRTESASPLTLRRTAGAVCGPEEVDTIFDRERRLDRIDWDRVRFAASPSMEIVTRHHVVGGALIPSEYRLRVKEPFADELAVPGWVAQLVSKCDGNRDFDAIHTAMQEQHPQLQRPDFAAAVRRLCSLGAIVLVSG